MNTKYGHDFYKEVDADGRLADGAKHIPTNRDACIEPLTQFVAFLRSLGVETSFTGDRDLETVYAALYRRGPGWCQRVVEPHTDLLRKVSRRNGKEAWDKIIGFLLEAAQDERRVA